jgi:hypothetical protein
MLRKSLHHGAYSLGKREIILLCLAEIKICLIQDGNKLKRDRMLTSTVPGNNQTFGYAQPPLIPIGRPLKCLFERNL